MEVAKDDEQEAANDLEPWMTISPCDATVWKSELEKRGCDRQSMQALFLLSQSSDAGRAHANAIISKLLKKEQEGTTIDNYSAFVWKAASNIRKQSNWVVE